MSDPSPPFSTNELYLEPPSAQQKKAIHTIAWYAIVITMSYVFLYLFFGLYPIAYFNMFICLIYTILFKVNDSEKFPVRIVGIFFMLVALLQTACLAALFAPLALNMHLWLIVIPFFAIITIDQRDTFWSITIGIIATLILVLLEWYKGIYTPPFVVEFPEFVFPMLRAGNPLIIILFVAGIFGYYYQRLTLARQEIQNSYERSEHLLLNILPESIAQRLKVDSSTIADDIEEASVLFCDLVGFTTISSKQTAHETVDMLNGIFIAFDDAIEQYGLEKIKTIGDAYMIASGVPNPRPDHAKQLILLAQELFTILAEYNERYQYNLSLRIGINSGPVTAGVIGKRKFSYDLWGDTVNVASRMESTGIPNRLQVTESVVKATTNDFLFEERDEILVKGKGKMRTYLLVDNK